MNLTDNLADVFRRDPDKSAHQRECAERANGLSGPEAARILVPEGMWPGSLRPADVERVEMQPPHDPLYDFTLQFVQGGEAVGDG